MAPFVLRARGMDQRAHARSQRYLDRSIPLSPEEEAALVTRYRATGDPRAEARLVAAYLRLVARLTASYRVREEDYEDLLQEGNLGLVQAVRRFDPALGRLSTYAAWWIRAYQLRFLVANHRLVRVGTSQSQRKLFFRMARTRARLEAAGVPADAETLASQIGVPVADVVEMSARLGAREASIDAARAGSRERPLVDALADGRDDPEAACGRAEERRLLARATGELRPELDERGRALLDARLCDPAPSLQQMGERFGISRERARQLDVRLVERLRDKVLGGARAIAAQAA